MRVLVVAAPLLGHLLPLIPLTDALRARGHEVRIASAGASVTRSGREVTDVSPGFRFDPVARRVLIRHPLLARAELAGTAGTRGVSLLFAAINKRLEAGLTAVVRDWSPELVIHEPLAPVAALIAARYQIPAVLQENSLYDGPTLVSAVISRMVGDLAPIAAETLTIAPPSMVGSRHGLAMRAVPYAPAGDVPDWLREPPKGRRRIVVSRSTVGGPGRDTLMSSVVAAAGRSDVEIVLVRPDRRVAGRSLPPGVRSVGWVPLQEILPTASGMIHHGGAGSVLTALAMGVPQLVVIGAGDRRRNAELVAQRGAGIAARASDIRPQLLDRLVSDPALASAAAEVGKEISTMPAPSTIVPRLESIG